MRAPTVGIYTLGCKVSQYESGAIAEQFEREGFTVLDFSEKCDFYVINTCTVTAESDRKSRQVIRRAARTNPEGYIMVCGCYSQRSPDEVRKIEGVSYLTGSDGKMRLATVARAVLEGKTPPAPSFDIDNADFEAMCITRSERTRAYVKIEDGCESRCAYCAIPSARGRVRSKAPNDVIREVEYLASRGTREIVLTGIETGSYGADFQGNYRLADLLAELDIRKSAERIRLGSLAPELIGKDFAEGVRDLKILAPHFHISLQSGSDNVLRSMRRRYLRHTAIENIERLREYIPGAMFTTDLMVGFPGESDEDFRDTVSIVSEAGLLDAHVFAYSQRHSTPASDFPNQIPESIKRRRSEQLISAVKNHKLSVLSGVLEAGRALSCIFESFEGNSWVGHSDSFIEVVYKPKEKIDLHGVIASVKPIALLGDKLLVDLARFCK